MARLLRALFCGSAALLLLLSAFAQTPAKRPAASRTTAAAKPATPPAAPRRHINEGGGPSLECTILSPFGSWFDVFRPKAGQFGPNEQFVLEGTLVRPDGTPAADLTVWLFKMNSKSDNGQPPWVGDLFLGVEDGKMLFVNPRGKTDSTGRFQITIGPAWKDQHRLAAGFVVRKSPDRPFDVDVFPIFESEQPLVILATAAQPKVDLGKIVVESKPAATP
jgi:hypothetical protein